jgi:hydroxymethylglutaryl-CoA lyase
LAGHFHDTYGQALTNMYASLLEGITVFDSSVAGLGGCLNTKCANGNVATEDLLYLLDNLGIDTEVDLTAVIATEKCISAVLGRESGSRVARAG